MSEEYGFRPVLDDDDMGDNPRRCPDEVAQKLYDLGDEMNDLIAAHDRAMDEMVDRQKAIWAEIYAAVGIEGNPDQESLFLVTNKTGEYFVVDKTAYPAIQKFLSRALGFALEEVMDEGDGIFSVPERQVH